MKRRAIRNREHKSPAVEPVRGGSTRPASPSPALTPAQQKILEVQAAAGNRAAGTLVGPGQPLPQPLLGEIESRFGARLADVRVHADAQARASAESFGARAYTIGDDIVLGERHAPDSIRAKELLAHEVAHVIQQRRGGTAPGIDNEGSAEREAHAAAAAFAGGVGPVAVSQGTSVGIARAETEEERLRKQKAYEDYEKRKGPIKTVPAPKEQPKSDRLGRIVTAEDRAKTRARDMETVGTTGEDPTPIKTRSWKEQGRDDYQGVLKQMAYEDDPRKVPPAVQADLQRQIKEGTRDGKFDETKTPLKLPKGYVLGHYEGEAGDPNTPAREGYDYNNARVITEEENKAEEMRRRQRAKLEKATPTVTAKQPAAPKVILRKKAPSDAGPVPQKTPVPGKTSAFIEGPESSSKKQPGMQGESLGEAQGARTRTVGTVVGIGLGLAGSYALGKYKEWMLDTMAKAPPVEINQDSLRDYLKRSSGQMRLIDLMAKDVSGLTGKVRTTAEDKITAATAATIGIGLARPERRRELLARLGEDMGSVADELVEIRDGAESALELEADAQERIVAARQLADMIMEKTPSTANAFAWEGLVRSGFGVTEILRMHDNLRAFAAGVERVLKDLHALLDVASEMLEKANSFASQLQGQYWKELLKEAQSQPK